MAAGWEPRFWTDRDIDVFIGTQSREIQNLMRNYPCGVMRSDAFRYLLLRRDGGLYVDLDFVNLAGSDWIEGIDGFACGDQGDGCLCNAFMWASRPGEPFFDGIEESLLARGSEPNPVCATGPRFLSAHAAGRKFQRIPSAWIYPLPWDAAEKIGEARSLRLDDLRERYPGARAIHIWTSSWFSQCHPAPAQTQD